MTKWYERIRRFGQTNLTEIDPIDCDIEFWKDYWKKTDTQAVIVNAGGIVAYYPSKYQLQYRAQHLGDRDFFGEYAAAAKACGLAVIARMDVNRLTEDAYLAHPEWFARHKDGTPYLTQGRYQCCVNSGYYKEMVPQLLTEICERYHPEGFTDNSWTGIPRTEICYCDACKEKFRAYSGHDLPENADYANPIYRRWIEWSYQCRTENWDLFNETVRKAGGEDCLWMGMVNANFVSGHATFCDLRVISRKSKLMMVDHQSPDGNGFEQNSLNGTVLHQLAGDNVTLAESMATYARGLQTYRRSANPALGTALWMVEGFAGGIRPWWHIVGGAQEDQRIYDLPVQQMLWHKQNEEYLYKRTSLASVGILWSQKNVEFYGQDKPRERVEHAFRGITLALTRAGLGYLPIHADDLDQQGKELSLLILPEMAVLSETQAQAIRRFAARGGSLLAIGSIGMMDETGEIRPCACLDDLMGIKTHQLSLDAIRPDASWEKPVLHNYLRVEDKTHPAFAGFEKADILPLGGTLREIQPQEGTKVLGTYIPTFPIFPPEFAWMREKRTDIPVLTEHALPAGGKCIYAAWELDAAYGRTTLPDYGDLLGNLIRYLLGGNSVIEVDAPGYVDFKLYRQGDRLLVHLVNLNHTGFQYAENLLPIGPVTVTLRVPGFTAASVLATTDAPSLVWKASNNALTITLDKLTLHQLLVIESK